MEKIELIGKEMNHNQVVELAAKNAQLFLYLMSMLKLKGEYLKENKMIDDYYLHADSELLNLKLIGIGKRKENN